MRGRTGLVMLAAPMLALALGSGCQTRAPSAEDRASYGAVAIVDSRDAPDREYDVPTAGWFAGLGHGTGRGLGAIVSGTLGGAAYGIPLGPLGMIAGAAVGCALGLVYTPISIIAGAATAADTDEVEALLPAFEAAVLDPALPTRFVAELETAARGLGVVSLVSRDAAVTICEVTLDEIAFGSSSEGLSVDSEFALKVTGSVRVYRAADGRTIWGGTRSAANPGAARHKFSVWAANDAELARRGIDAALKTLAQHLARVVFVGAP